MVTAIEAVKVARLTVRLSSSSGPRYCDVERASWRSVSSSVVPGSRAASHDKRAHHRGKETHKEQAQRKTKEHRHQKEQGIGKGIAALRAKADGALLAQLVPAVQGQHQQEQVQIVALPQGRQHRPGLLPAQGDDRVPRRENSRAPGAPPASDATPTRA